MSDYLSIQRIGYALIKIIPYLDVTLGMVLVSMGLGIIIGTVMAFIDMKRVPVLRNLVAIHVSFARAVPPLVKLMLVYCGLPVLAKWLTGIDINRWDSIFFATVTMVIGQSASMCVMLEGVIKGVPTLQMEAAYSVGMTSTQAFMRIILPQAFRTAIPIFSNNLVAAFQGTSIAFMIGTMDIMGRAKIVGTTTHHLVDAYVAVTIIYIVISLIIKTVFQKLNERINFGRS